MKWLLNKIAKMRATAAWREYRVEHIFELELLKLLRNRAKENLDILTTQKNECVIRNRKEYNGLPLSKIHTRIMDLTEYIESVEFDIKSHELIGETMKKKIFEQYGVTNELA